MKTTNINWISVQDRLPSEACFALVLIKGRNGKSYAEVACYSVEDGLCVESDADISSDRITHWILHSGEKQRLKNEMDEAFFALEDYSVELTGLAGEWEKVALTARGIKLLTAYVEAKEKYETAEKHLLKTEGAVCNEL